MVCPDTCADEVLPMSALMLVHLPVPTRSECLQSALEADNGAFARGFLTHAANGKKSRISSKFTPPG